MVVDSCTLNHGALAAVDGDAPRKARLSDRQRLAVVLEAAALLGHLQRAGRRLAGGWNGVRITVDGRLAGVATEPGAEVEPAQNHLTALLLRLFGAEETVAGRGAARRCAREMLVQWRADIERLPPDLLVTQVLNTAEFLWEAEFGESRAALVAEFGDEPSELWVVGPRRFRRRVLRTGGDLAALKSLLATAEVRRLWRRSQRSADPRQLVLAGRWHQASEQWLERPPGNADDRLEAAIAHHAVGRFAVAKETLHGLRRPRARVLRLDCQLRLGELAAARRGLKAWSQSPPSGTALIDLAAIAARVYANSGEPEAAEPWIVRALAARERVLRLRAEIIAGESAWDRGDLAAAEQRLAATASGANEPEAGWRRSQLAALLAMAAGDGRAVVAAISSALGARRRLRPFEAVGLWNDLAVGRSMTGDLAGAERALRHVVRLSRETEGDRRTTLALCNLAEIRLRRGHVKGVQAALELSQRANYQAGNWRGWAQDQELKARYELLRGRPGAALECIEGALETLADRGFDWRRGQLQVLAARAHGWLGQVLAARTALDSTRPEDRAELEPEERAPLWALAGDLENALEENPAGPCQLLWRQLLTGSVPVDWSALDSLEPYRAARLILDVELLGAGRVPRQWLRCAAEALREVGAGAWAERLVATDDGPWRAIEGYLRSAEVSPLERLATLLREVSPEARLTWRDAESEVELVAAAGGKELLERPFHSGDLRLQAAQISACERVVFAIAHRDLPAELVGQRIVQPRARSGMIGNSPSLIAALDRLSKLARRELPMLLEGETGTGKELAARAVHDGSARAAEVFLPVNCAAFAENLLLSELFGHVRGAFTGADRDRPGIFEAARGGTVFLDEIGDFPLLAQAKLLRVLQEGEVRRVGESVARPVDVRVVAATHRDLAAMVAASGFRQDLFYRLKVGRVSLPPLRDRGKDLALLTEHFLAEEGAGTTPRLSSAARNMLNSHSWPGNVRELKNVLIVAVALADGGTLEPEHLDLPQPSRTVRSGYHEQVKLFRQRLIQEGLDGANGNRAEAARRLGLTRQALSYLVRQLDIDID